MKKKFLIFPLLSVLLCSCALGNLLNSNSQKSTENPGDNDKIEPENPTEIKVSSVSLNKKTLNLVEGTSEVLTYTVSPVNATNKDVKWSTSDATIASVSNGKVSAWNVGTATITVTTVDQSKTDSCTVTVTKKPAPQGDTTTANIVFNDLGYSKDDSDYSDPVAIDEKTSVTFAQAEGQTAPSCIKGTNTKKYEARAYGGNTITFSNSESNILSITFVFSTDKPGTNTLTPDVGSYDEDEKTWTGSSTTVVFSVGGESGHRRFSSISVTYEGKTEDDPEEVVNLGVKTIKEVRQYIASHPVKKNSFGNGVNENRYVTIKGFALARIDLVKTKASFGLDVSYPAKVIMADSTGYIAVATQVSGDGTTLWGKIDDNVCKPDAKYSITGYISEYLGHPELMITAFEWNKNLDITWSPSVLSEATTDLAGFYQKAADVNYNCAGHGYGEVITMNNLKCINVESDGSGRRFYNFTDGIRSLRVNAYNLGSVSRNSYYNVVGIISLKNLSPIIFGFDISPTVNPVEFDFSYEIASSSNEITVSGLKQIHGSQEDASTRYPDVVNAFGNVYKANVYVCLVEEGGKGYVGISDTYHNSIISGKKNAMANYGVALITNDGFWNVSGDDLDRYNDLYIEYGLEDKKTDVYFVPRSLDYQSNKPLWEILLIPDFIDSLKTE